MGLSSKKTSLKVAALKLNDIRKSLNEDSGARMFNDFSRSINSLSKTVQHYGNKTKYKLKVGQPELRDSGIPVRGIDQTMNAWITVTMDGNQHIFRISFNEDDLTYWCSYVGKRKGTNALKDSGPVLDTKISAHIGWIGDTALDIVKFLISRHEWETSGK